MACMWCGGSLREGERHAFNADCREALKAECGRYRAALEKLNRCNCEKRDGRTLDGHEDWCARLIAHNALHPTDERTDAV